MTDRRPRRLSEVLPEVGAQLELLHDRKLPNPGDKPMTHKTASGTPMIADPMQTLGEGPLVAPAETVNPAIGIPVPLHQPTQKRSPSPAPRYRCGCGQAWTALGAAHCSACHRTFSAASLFDKHRTAAGERGTCLDPGRLIHATTEQRVMFFRDGMWRGPELTDEQRTARFGTQGVPQ